MSKIPVLELEKRCDIYKTLPKFIMNLRHKVLRPGLPLETAAFDGDDLHTTWHLGLTYHKHTGNHPVRAELVSCASFMLNEYRGHTAHQLRGMATEPEYQGWGFGTILLQWSERLVVGKTGIRLFWCNARVTAIPFYEKSGWHIVGDVFNMETAGPHRVMTKCH